MRGDIAITSDHGKSAAELRMIRNMFCKGSTPEQFDLFMSTARHHNLSPVKRQIYGIIRQERDPEASDAAKKFVSRPVLTIVIGIDGFRVNSAKTGTYAPDDEAPRFTFLESAKDPETNPLGIVDCEVCLKKFHQVSGQWLNVASKVDWAEYAPIKERTNWDKDKRVAVGTGEFYLTSPLWLKMPKVMIAKCAEAAAHRKGWPDVHSGLYEAAEMDQALATDIIEHEEERKRLEAVGGRDGITLQFAVGDPLEVIPQGEVHDRVMAWLRDQESPTGIEVFINRNQASLRQFWGLDKDAGMDLKVQMQARVEALEGQVVEPQA
jgi:phage recombination protein Bet